ncbi:diacylglycerol kinase family protein [Salibacterium sp. K-3]
MIMDLKDKRNTGWGRLFRSFRYAWTGLMLVIREEQNMRFHLLAAGAAVICGFVFSIPALHWMILIVVIGGMLALEIVNTALERTVDMIIETYHPAAEKAKDIAAAAVFVYSLTAVIIGILIFYQPVVERLLH